MTSVAQRLRQKLLDLAIHGKLVPQNPQDEPAGELLARIRKARNATARARTSVEPLSVPEDEIPFDLPRGWVWCRLGEVCDVLAGFPFDSKKYVETGIKICGGLIIMPDKIKWHECKHWPDSSGYEAYLLQKNDVVVALDRPWITDGFKVGIVKDSDLPALLIQRTARLRSDYVEADYLVSLLSSDRFRLFCDPTGTTVPHISHTDILNFPIPLPPLAEQKRIVGKLNAMLKEATRVAEGTERLALLRKKARAKILDLAIRGKLVKQEKSDEPASELLKRIATEKSKMVAEKKIKKEKPLPPIADDEIPFDLPKGWAWCRFRELGVLTGGHTPSMRNPKFWGGDVLWVTSKDMKRKYIDDTGSKITKLGAEGLIMLKPGAILMCTRSGILRRTFPVAVAAKELTINQDQRALSPFVLEMSEYVYTVLCALEPMILADYRKTGTTVESIIWEKFIDMPIPLPPLAEQRRIVAKVKEMLAACDALGGEG